MMTLQEIFNKVVQHLNKQGRKSLLNDTSCSYRGSEGAKCAVGCLIKDEYYSEKLEGGSVRIDAVIDALQLSGVVASNERYDFATGKYDAKINMLAALQSIHDMDMVESWPVELQQIAAEFGLEMPVWENQ